jgi:ribosomal protein L12E/L44/L45/RPP1/RPP2
MIYHISFRVKTTFLSAILVENHNLSEIIAKGDRRPPQDAIMSAFPSNIHESDDDAREERCEESREEDTKQQESEFIPRIELTRLVIIRIS